MRQLSFSIVLRQAATGTLAAAALLAGTAAQAGSIEAAEFKSATLQRSWTYNVYLPTGYDAQSRLRYPSCTCCTAMTDSATTGPSKATCCARWTS